MSRDGQATFIGTRMASCAQRTHTKYVGWLLATRRLYETKIEWLTASLTLIDFLFYPCPTMTIVKKKLSVFQPQWLLKHNYFYWKSVIQIIVRRIKINTI